MENWKQSKAVQWVMKRSGLLFFIIIILLISFNLPGAINGYLPDLGREITVWGLPEDAVCLYPDRSMDLIGYEVDSNRFTPMGSDPQMGFVLHGEAPQYLLIELAEPVGVETQVELYYDERTGELSEERKLEGWMNRGDSQLTFTLPSAEHDHIRIDINGEVLLKGIYYSSTGFIESNGIVPPSKKKVVLVYGVCLLFFMAIVVSIGMAIFGKKKTVKTAAYIITGLARVWLGITAGVWYPQGQTCDDALIFHYANLSSYFANTEVSSRDVMLKELGMPFILNIVNLIGISYTMFLSLLWVLNGILAVLLVKRIGRGKRPRAEFLTFLFVLFQPVALEKWTGTRLYRNALLTPLYFLVFLIGLIILYNLLDGTGTRIRESLLLSIPLGVTFSLAYLIKEDGVWLLLSVVVLFLIVLYVAIYKIIKRQINRRSRLYVYASAIIPFVILFATITGVKQLNYDAFGVYETNARTAGEEGKFVTYVYKTASDERNLDIWAPTDAITSVFKASKTLRKNKALKKAVFNTPWRPGGIKKNPIQGDFLTWVLKDALFDSNTCTTKRQAEKYMKKVNQELEEAFKNGTLQKDNRFQLVSSLAGISKGEIVELLKNTLVGYKDALSTAIYDPGASINDNGLDDTQFASIMANQDLNAVVSVEAHKFREYEVVIANAIIRTVFRIYDWIQPVLFVLGIISAFVAMIGILKMLLKRNTFEIYRFTKSLLVLFFLSLSFAYLFSIAWFTYYLHNEYFSYFFGIGALPLITLFQIIGLSLLCDKAELMGSNNKTLVVKGN